MLPADGRPRRGRTPEPSRDREQDQDADVSPIAETPQRGLQRELRAFASLPAVDVRRLAREERAEFAAFLATLPPPQWQAPTLCAQWRVRDVVAHVISYDQISVDSLLALAAGASSGPAGSTPPRWPATTRAARRNCSRCWQITCSPGGCPRRWAAGSP